MAKRGCASAAPVTEIRRQPTGSTYDLSCRGGAGPKLRVLENFCEVKRKRKRKKKIMAPLLDGVDMIARSIFRYGAVMEQPRQASEGRATRMTIPLPDEPQMDVGCAATC